MRTKDVVEKTGLSRDTIRFYEKEQLISAPERKANRYREYTDSVITQLMMITRAKELGFTLREIRELTRLLYTGDLTRKEMAKQLEVKSSEIDRKISELLAIKEEIDKARSGLCDYKNQLK